MMHVVIVEHFFLNFTKAVKWGLSILLPSPMGPALHLFRDWKAAKSLLERGVG